MSLHRLIEQCKVRHIGSEQRDAWGMPPSCAASAGQEMRPVSVQNAYQFFLQRRIEHGLH